MKTQDEIKRIIERVSFQGRRFDVTEYKGVLHLQVVWMGRDAETDKLEELKSRKWQLSYHMTTSELVQTALKAVLTAEEHEIRERFRYRGRTVFGPHFDVDALWEIAGKKDIRDSL